MSESLKPSVEEKFPELEKGSLHHGRLMKAYGRIEERRRQQKLLEVRAELKAIQVGENTGINSIGQFRDVTKEEDPVQEAREWKQRALLPMEGVVFERGRKL